MSSARRRLLMRKLNQIIVLLVAGCSSYQISGKGTDTLSLPKEIVYLSSDLAHVAIFSEEKTRFGPTDLTIVNPDWPSSSARFLEAGDGMQCLSGGKGENSTEYAVKRPIRLQEKYKCSGTSFRVAQCFDSCTAAIVEIGRRLSGTAGGTRKAYMYLDSCRGVIILSEV